MFVEKVALSRTAAWNQALLNPSSLLFQSIAVVKSSAVPPPSSKRRLRMRLPPTTFAKFSRPPVATLSVKESSSSTACSSFRRMASTSSVESRLNRRAAAPDTNGDAIEVPSALIYCPLRYVLRMPTPGAAKSTETLP